MLTAQSSAMAHGTALDRFPMSRPSRYSILWPFWKYAARNLCIFPDLPGIS